jgi:hypothetical protein
MDENGHVTILFVILNLTVGKRKLSNTLFFIGLSRISISKLISEAAEIAN